MPKLNCWEFKKCGYEQNGANSRVGGVCPAATDHRLDGVHGGINGGRSCWVVTGTMSDGNIQGNFSMKIQQCSKCGFFYQVRKEEGDKYIAVKEVLKKIT
ncbi:MAG: hypothetical protein JW803_06405 [Endomicrobiales bacterium]|nr:hypothetical protein [Endomicrobiales bacterium]